MVGYQAKSDKIDVSASEFMVVAKTNRAQAKQSKAFAKTATCTYSIDFSKEGEGDF